jgi:predicted dinucleotide-binding enzyme
MRRDIMKVGIIGSGDVAKALARGFLKHGHAVLMGTREGGKLAAFAGEHPGVKLGGFADAAGFGEVVVLAVKGGAALDAMRLAGAGIEGKVVIDATNPIADAPPVHGVLQFFTGPNDSLGERLQSAFPKVKFVKAYNSVGHAAMVDPKFDGGPPTMFIAGNDDQAKATASDILKAFGWEAADMGPIEASRALEPLCQLWCIPGFTRNDWYHAFKLLR